jgi:hypothetical protein
LKKGKNSIHLSFIPTLDDKKKIIAQRVLLFSSLHFFFKQKPRVEPKSGRACGRGLLSHSLGERERERVRERKAFD